MIGKSFRGRKFWTTNFQDRNGLIFIFGQFRTPRHIIDFIVEVVDPKKNETILDPACGTAGFLISAYKHILKQNKEKALTPDEKLKLMNNLAGYDISPDMVKLA